MRAIRRSKRHQDLIEQLAVRDHSSAGRPVFPTMRELLCFAAVLGFSVQQKKPLDAETEEIDGRTFEGYEQSRDLIYLLAIADRRDAEVLRDENEDACVRVFEEYAEGGLREISSWLSARPEDDNGDTALLEAMGKKGFLGESRTVENAIHDVKF